MLAPPATSLLALLWLAGDLGYSDLSCHRLPC
jgi:hypothetical protein